MPEPTAEERAAELNRRLWRGSHVAEYDRTDLRPVEVLLLVRHREELSGRVLEVGCGAGRVTRYLAEIAEELHAIDVSPEMVAHVRRTLPDVHADLADARDMPGAPSGVFDAVLATCNVLDALHPGGREQALREALRVLRPGGLLIFSAHNRAAAPDIRRPSDIRLADGPRQLVKDVLHLPQRVHNRRVRLPLERRTDAYAILNDVAHDYAVLHYYVFRDDQVRQLDAIGLETEVVLDLDGHVVRPGEHAAWAHELHYVARTPAPA